MRILFENAERRVSIAASVAEALGVGKSDPADLVLLDLTLPDGSGLDLEQPLLAAGCKTIVAITGHDDTDTRARRKYVPATTRMKPTPVTGA